MTHSILEKAASTFWRDLGRGMIKTATTAVVSEIVRANVDIWKQMRLKHKRRSVDLIFRDEDDAYKERKDQLKKEREEAEKRERERREREDREEELREQEEIVITDPVSPTEPPKQPVEDEDEDRDGTLGGCYFVDRCD